MASALILSKLNEKNAIMIFPSNTFQPIHAEENSKVYHSFLALPSLITVTSPALFCLSVHYCMVFLKPCAHPSSLHIPFQSCGTCSFLLLYCNFLGWPFQSYLNAYDLHQRGPLWPLCIKPSLSAPTLLYCHLLFFQVSSNSSALNLMTSH